MTPESLHQGPRRRVERTGQGQQAAGDDAAWFTEPDEAPGQKEPAGAEAAAGAEGGAGDRSTGGADIAERTAAPSRSATERRRLALAVTFLTSIPLKVAGDVSPQDLWGSMGWYPLVGLVMGAAAWGVFAALSWLLPPLVAAALVVLLLEAFTRGLHLDGLMDTCDGYFSGAPRERALEIMKDSRAGAMGVAGAVLVIVLKVAALGALSRSAAAGPLLAGWAAARALPALDVVAFPYARSAGTGEPFTRDRTPGPLELSLAWLAAAFAAAVMVTLLVHAPAAGYAPLIVVAVAMGVTLLLQAVVARRLGGLTGDVYGMGIELAETAALVAGCALLRL